MAYHPWKCLALVTAMAALAVGPWASTSAQQPTGPAQAGAPAAEGEGQNPPEIHFISRADVEAAWQEAEKQRRGDGVLGAQVMTAFAARFPDTDYARQALYQAGVSLQNQRLIPEAIAAYRDLLTRYPGHDLCDDALWQIATLLTQQSDFVGAANAYLEFQRRFPRNPNAERALSMAASQFSRAGDLQSCMAAYDALVRQYPYSDLAPSALYSMGQTYVRAVTDEMRESNIAPQFDQFGPAVQAYQTLIRTYPYSNLADDAAYQLAYLYYTVRDYQGCVDAMEDFMRRYPASSMVSSARNMVNTALRSMRQLYRYDPNERLPTPEPLLQPAQRLSALRRWPEVIALYQQAIQAFPGHDNQDDWVLAIGDTYQQAGDLPSAIKTWRNLVDNYPGSEQRQAAMLRIVQALTTARDVPGKIQAQSDYITLFPTGARTEAFWNEVLAYYRSERQVGALLAALKSVYTNYVGLDLVDNALFEAGNINQQLRKYTDAAALYAALVQNYPGSDLTPDATFLLACCQHEAGDLDKARATYQRVAATMPNTGLADDALTEMRVLESPAELERLRLYREAPLPADPPAGSQPEKWESCKDPLEPMVEGVCGPLSVTPGAYTPVHLRFRMERQFPILLTIKWMQGDQQFANVQVYLNGELAHSVYVRPNTVTELKLLATRTVQGVNTITLSSLDNTMRWDAVQIASEGLPAEREGRIVLGVPDDASKEFSVGATASRQLAFTELFVDLDENKWATRLDPEYQAFREAVAAVTPVKPAAGAKGEPAPPPAKTPADLYREYYQLARGYYARGYFFQAAKLLMMLTREPLPPDLVSFANALLAMALDNARDYGLEEIRRGNLVMLAPPATAMQLRQYNVPDYYDHACRLLAMGGPEPSPTDPPFVIGCPAYSYTSGPNYARLNWNANTRTSTAAWAPPLAALAQSWVMDPRRAPLIAPAHPTLLPGLAALAAVAIESQLSTPGVSAQQDAQIASRRGVMLSASAATEKKADPKKVSADAVAGWMLRLALGKEFAKAKTTDWGWEKLAAVINALRTLPPKVAEAFPKPADRQAVVAWVLSKHFGKEAVPQLTFIGIEADEKALATVEAVLVRGEAPPQPAPPAARQGRHAAAGKGSQK
ncbi:MAG: tetratricopeptide repeat protein [Armatimonadota bacterium]|nr:tetratricopeptide repeat protein [Armatimonadota bacterium]